MGNRHSFQFLGGVLLCLCCCRLKISMVTWRVARLIDWMILRLGIDDMLLDIYRASSVNERAEAGDMNSRAMTLSCSFLFL